MSAVALTVNGRRVRARTGQTLLEAALAGGQVIPHDCATGQCETCRVTIESGLVEEAGTRQGSSVLACRARLAGDAAVAFEEVPEVVRHRGTVARLVALSPTIVEIEVALRKPIAFRPGQYLRVAFADLPPRDYSPTLRSDGTGDADALVFQIRRQPGGLVSAHLGGRIGPGTTATVEGPFGHAFHRPGAGRLIVVSGGVGWAPAWAVARASRLIEPERPLTVIAGARDPADLYMRPALAWLAARGAETVLTCSGTELPVDARAGRPTAHLPRLTDTDTVLAAGTPGLVTAVQALAREAGATCYADPFTAASPQPRSEPGLLRRWTGFLPWRSAKIQPAE